MICILGRSGVGKDSLAKELSKFGLAQVMSYATRKPRYEGEDTHVFISREEALRMKDEWIASTEINGSLYFVTRKQLEDCDVYIIDPKGLYDLINDELVNGTHLIDMIVYVTASQIESQEHAVMRGSNTEQEVKTYKKRREFEDLEFAGFEKNLSCFDVPVLVLRNHYDAEEWKHAAKAIAHLYRTCIE